MPVGTSLEASETLRDRNPDTQCDDSWSGIFMGAFALAVDEGTGVPVSLAY